MPEARSHLQVAIQERTDGGVSHYMHENLSKGSAITTRGPRNNFSFELGARKTVLIAGGIGVTPPILPMARVAKSAALDYYIIYLGRSRTSLAFVDELTIEHGGRCTVWVPSEHGGRRFNLPGYLRNHEVEGLGVYFCGPEELVEKALEIALPGVLRLERFVFNCKPESANSMAFDVVFVTKRHNSESIPEYICTM